MNIPENLKELIKSGILNIQTILKEDLRQKEKNFFANGELLYKEEMDSRVAFLQLVENLSSILYPYFDQQMQDYYSQNQIFLSGWYFEILNQFEEDDYFLKVYNDAPHKADKGTLTKTDIMLSLQVRKAKEMFRELNLFVQRSNLLRDSTLKTEAQNYER